jgi:isopentenyl phosphate kinase
MPELVFLKLGGSLITDKARPFTPRLELLADLAGQIAQARNQQPTTQLLLGHGSGSFGHTPAAQHNTRAGVSTPAGWLGFSEVWWQASSLNRHVMEALHGAGLPAVSLPPLASLTARDGGISSWDLDPLTAALAAGLLPVIYGDVVFDEVRGGTILSTEDLFAYLARELAPERILLAGLERAVWADYPVREQPVESLTRESYEQIAGSVGEASGTDVTGGMRSKITEMLDLVQDLPSLKVQVFSGVEPGNVLRALLGEQPGTLITR